MTTAPLASPTLVPARTDVELELTPVPAAAKLLLDDARRRAGLSSRELLDRYTALGGTRTLGELEDYLRGHVAAPASEYGLMARAIIETTGGAQARVRRPTVSVVVPTLNEAANLPHVLGRIPPIVDEVIVVDGRSTDDTVAVARSLRPDAKILVQNGTGKGNALACGLRAVTGDITVTIDADGSTDPAEIPHFVDALVAGNDFAMGSRFRADGGSADITRLRRLGNRLLTFLVNRVWRSSYSDLCYGYSAFWTRHLGSVNTDCNGFEVETLIHIGVARSGLRVTEVPSFEGRRLHGKSNLKVGRDGMRVLRTILAEWMRPN